MSASPLITFTVSSYAPDPRMDIIAWSGADCAGSFMVSNDVPASRLSQEELMVLWEKEMKLADVTSDPTG